jgi:hypothetical protein
MDRGKSDRGSGVASHRLGQDLGRGYAAHFASHRGSLLQVRDSPEIAALKKRFEARDRLAQHRVASRNIQQLFRRAHPAARPESSAAPAGKKNRTSRQS